MTIPRLLTIAGSDSGGGAGIQADLKAFAHCGCHGMSAITAVTAQNTREVTAVYQLPPDAVIEQVRSVRDDIGIDAVKIGMLGTTETIRAVERALDLVGGAPVVIDPVMVSESGGVLLDEDAREALRDRLLPRATVVTPNVPEARVLAGAGDHVDPEELAPIIHALGPSSVVITGGHREEATDLFFDGRELCLDSRRALCRWRGPRFGMHPLVRAGGAPGPGVHRTASGLRGEGGRGRGSAPRAAGDRRGRGAGERPRVGSCECPGAVGRPR